MWDCSPASTDDVGGMGTRAGGADVSFHADVDVDDSLLYATAVGTQSADRASVAGHFFDRAGRAVVTTSYECFIRVFRS